MEIKPLQKVLIVDSCSADRYILEYYLCAEYEAYSVENGERALLALEAEEFDCFIINTELPDCSGSDLIKSFQTLYGAIPVILITADDDKIKQAALPLVGVTICLNKELVTQQELLNAVRGLLQETHMIEERYV
jgi:CheY-like chemotaxis protein